MTAPSNLFGSRRPQIPHLGQSRHGLSGEVNDLRQDIEAAFKQLEMEGVGPATSVKAVNGAQGLIIFRPGGTASPGVVTTWANLMAAVANHPTALRIYLDFEFGATFNVPAGIWDLNGAWVFFPYNTLTSRSTLNIPNGARLRNLGKVLGCGTIRMNTTTVGAPSLDWTAPAGVLPGDFWPTVRFDEWSVLEQAGSQPGIIVDPAVCIGFNLDLAWHGWFSYIGTARAIHIKSGGSAEIAFGAENYPTFSMIPNLIEAADATCSVFIGNNFRLGEPGAWFPGVPLASLFYDRLKGDAMTSVEAVTIKNGTVWLAGDWYYDTTLHKPIYYDGTIWRDAVGAPA